MRTLLCHKATTFYGKAEINLAIEAIPPLEIYLKNGLIGKKSEETPISTELILKLILLLLFLI